MIILSLNGWGFASSPKKLALKEVVCNYNLNILLHQETLGVGEEVSTSLSKLRPGWSSQALDSKGQSGGIEMGVK